MSAIKSWLCTRRWLRLTLIEWLTILATIAVLIALLLPGIQRGGSGFIDVPIRVLVYDAETGKPLAGAAVDVTGGGSWPLTAGQYNPPRFSEYLAQSFPENHVVTGIDGTVRLTKSCFCSSSNNGPMWADVHHYLAIVQADQYSGVIVPVRHERMTNNEIRAWGELLVPVGLLRIKR